MGPKIFESGLEAGKETEKEVKFPEDEDLSGAATAILRLQDVYKLDSYDLANGVILGDKVSPDLTAHDAFELENEEEKTVEETEILEYLAYSLYQQGNVRRALALTKRLAAIAPNHPRAKGNVKWYEDMLHGKDMEGDLPPIVNKTEADVQREEYDGVVERDAYEALCRGEVPPMPPAEAKLLFCYLKMDKPFLRLAPIKVEILRLDPLAVLFKEVISDAEIEVIKETATPKLRRATVQNAVTGELETASYRISKSAWLKEDEHEVIARVNRRIEDMTNLNQKTSEDLQDLKICLCMDAASKNPTVANYGLGGHYDPHFDFARIANYGIGGHYAPHFDMSTRGEKEPYRVNGNRVATVLFYKEEKNAFKNLNTGNRLATVLFYMSQPERGGATVFNHLGTAVFPTKHDALFWYNLMRSGEGDLRTRHAACPVLLGVKWVSNKWIHERGQEFTRPCGLDEEVQELFVGDLSPRKHGIRHKYNVSNM
ncbi:tetratricopeptide repeat protein [Oesophagostomum dentatum]|uniref:procollagen-proline 4-dioxygenase n=1 Tax=Oesophagostomum dentatum TaxID=61180 RepID=A0A0B1TK73_OESDE|nr:tetratricopeptide repeat protein [Oesophagostomum dentatum]